MVRICPFGRITAGPPPRRDTCRPGRGRFTVFGRVAILPLAFAFPIDPGRLMFPVAPGRLMFPAPPGLPIVVDPGLAVVPVVVLPPMVVLFGRFPMLVFG